MTGLILLWLALAAPTAESPSAYQSSHITGPFRPIPVEPGVNRIPGFAPDGSEARIISAWFGNGNAWGHREFQVLIPSGEGDWNIVPFQPNNRSHLNELPHAAYDALSVVRFAWARENGRQVALAIEAGREPQNSVPAPAKTTITIYAMRANRDVGTTPIHFTPVRRWIAKRKYCHAEMALRDELGLPLSADYSGSRRAGGCS